MADQLYHSIKSLDVSDVGFSLRAEQIVLAKLRVVCLRGENVHDTCSHDCQVYITEY